MFLKQFTLILYNLFLAICCCVRNNIVFTKFIHILMYQNQVHYITVIRQKGKSRNGFSRKQSMPNFPKNEHFLPPHMYTCVYQGVRNVHFSEYLECFILLKHPFWYLPFCPITNNKVHGAAIICGEMSIKEVNNDATDMFKVPSD